jgi:serine/threonine protein kinase
MLCATATATMASAAGTARWMAPELLDPDEHHSEVSEDEVGKSTKRSDVYSLAITFWEVSHEPAQISKCSFDHAQIFSGELPFGDAGKNSVALARKVLRGDRPPRLPEYTARGLDDDIWSCMEAWWANSPSQRPALTSDTMEDDDDASALPSL